VVRVIHLVIGGKVPKNIVLAERRLAYLEEKQESGQKLTDDEQRELPELRDQLTEQSKMNGVTRRLSTDFDREEYLELLNYADENDLTLKQAMKAFVKQGLENTNAGGSRDPNADLVSLCRLEDLHANAANQDIKDQIAQRVRRQYGIDLDDSDDIDGVEAKKKATKTNGGLNGSNGTNGANGTRKKKPNPAEMRQEWENFQKVGGHKDWDEWKKLSDQDRAILGDWVDYRQHGGKAWDWTWLDDMSEQDRQRELKRGKS